MGLVIVEIPQNVNRSYRIDDSTFGEKLLEELEPFSGPAKQKIIPPRRNDREKALKAVLGIWSDRKESAQEIADNIRENNRRVT